MKKELDDVSVQSSKQRDTNFTGDIMYTKVLVNVRDEWWGIDPLKNAKPYYRVNERY